MTIPQDPVVVLSTRPFAKHHLDAFRGVSALIEVRQQLAESSAEVTAALASDIEVLYTSYPPLELPCRSNLKWVHFHRAGVDHVVGTPLWSSDVLLSTGNGIHATTIAEFTIAMMLAQARRLIEIVDFQREHTWPAQSQARLVGRELRDATVTIVGYGGVGREIERLCHALGMNTRVVRRSSSQVAERWAPDGIAPSEEARDIAFYQDNRLIDALHGADYVVLAAPLTARTRGMIGATELRAMKDTSVLVNVARGELVRTAELVEALNDGFIAGACLDVVESEPLPANSPLWKMPNVIVSPHIAGITPRYMDYAADLFRANLARYMDGRTLINAVDRSREY
jgi:phosphoglycerate dehydrogenase-like enzyme